MRADLRADLRAGIVGLPSGISAARGTDRAVSNPHTSSSRIVGRAVIDERFSGLRGFAALGVVITHYHYNGLLAGFPVFKYAGQFQIFLFFFLSSFLLAHSLEASSSRGGAVRAIVNFSINRVFRIFPMLVLTVFLTSYFGIAYFDSSNAPFDSVTNAYAAGGYSFPRALRSTLTIGKAPSVLWTIPIELTFYLILPFLFFFLRFVRGFRSGPAAMICGFAVWCLLIQALSLTSARNSFLVTLGIHHYINILVGGAVGYVLLVPEGGLLDWPTKATNLLMKIAPLAFPLFVLLFPFFTRGLLAGDLQLSGMPEDADRQAYYNWIFPLMPLLIGLIFVGLLYNGNSPLAVILKTRVFQWLGFASFSLYLLHIPILELWKEHFGSSEVQLFLCLSVTVAVSWVCAAVVERSFIHLGKRLNLG